jgi:hypothetical protein
LWKKKRVFVVGKVRSLMKLWSKNGEKEERKRKRENGRRKVFIREYIVKGKGQ